MSADRPGMSRTATPRAASSRPVPGSLERLTLQSDLLRAVVIPELGGKLASLALIPPGGRSGSQLLQGMLKPYKLRTSSMAFDESDGSGWDECLPSVAACEFEHDGEMVEVGDHGDFWRLVWAVEEQTEERLRITASGTSLPLFFERTMALDGNRLTLGYKVKNTGETSVPYGWSAHPLLAVDAGDRIILPPSVTEVTTESSGNGRLGETGTTHSWPFTANAKDGQALDLTTVGQPTDGVGDKIFLPAPREGWAALDRLTLGVRVTMRFDPDAHPWLGLWLCYGGWPAATAARKGFTVAIEPCTMACDSLAQALEMGQARTLGPGAEASWELVLEARRLDK